MSDRVPQFPAYQDISIENWLRVLRQTKELAQILATRGQFGLTITPLDGPDIDHVQHCYEELVYAYTIECAMFWHAEIINELALLVHASNVQPWPEIAKRGLIDALEFRIAEHCKQLSTLSGVLQRQEQCVWKL